MNAEDYFTTIMNFGNLKHLFIFQEVCECGKKMFFLVSRSIQEDVFFVLVQYPEHWTRRNLVAKCEKQKVPDLEYDLQLKNK